MKQSTDYATYQKVMKGYLTELNRSLRKLDKKAVYEAIGMIIAAYYNRRKIFVMGNGGSAVNASHMACDLGKGTLARHYDEGELRLRVISLTDNVATMTAYGNDMSFDDIFVQQLQNLVEPNDIVIAMSGSGNSRNVIKAVKYAKKYGAKTIGFLGFKTGGKLARMVDCAIIVDSKFYGPCEDIQLVLDHIITSCIARLKRRIGERAPKNSGIPFRLQDSDE